GEGYLSIPIVSRDPITKFADLEGKTIGATALTGTSPDGLKYLLSEAGLSPDSIKLIQLPYSAHPDNLKAGNVDAVLSANPYFPGLAEDGFHVFPEDVPAAAMAAVTNGKSKTASPLMFCANTVWVEKNADVVNAWVKSVQEAAKFSNENKEEARAILTQWLNFSDDLAAQVIIPDFEEEVDAEPTRL
ncbi:ABC transporter substrate-binding protein, partial [Priestia megaterium]|uniref:ABC transporter substrate-binding protein n=1 Tax=Priestia megaterium TaxID=1404 RepID=UPI00128F9326